MIRVVLTDEKVTVDIRSDQDTIGEVCSRVAALAEARRLAMTEDQP